MFNDLGELIKIIAFQTNEKEEWIAKQIGYSRSHFNVLKNKGGGDEVIELLQARFAKEIQQFVRRFSATTKTSQPTISLDTLAEKIDSVHSMLFGHVVRSGERYAKDDVKKASEEMERINSYAEMFLKANLKTGNPVRSQGKG